MRAPTTTGVEWPSPRSFTCHNSFVPPAGHCFSNPVSFETPLRFGPRHCGQSAASTLIAHKNTTRLRVNIRAFIYFLLRNGNLPLVFRSHDLYDEMVPRLS